MKQKSAPRPASLDARKIRRAYAPYRWEGRNFRLIVLILCIVLLLLRNNGASVPEYRLSADADGYAGVHSYRQILRGDFLPL